MPVFSRPGAQLSFEVSDEGGPAVVQLHGLTSSRYRERRLDLDLGVGLSGTRLLRFDARGHGRSTGSNNPDDYRWDVLADDLLALLEHVFPGEAVHGVGPSMGTGTLLHAITRAPSSFSALTLITPPTAWEARRQKSADYLAAAKLVEEEGMGTFIEAGRRAPRPPATVGHPETIPDVAEVNLPALLRGAAATNLPGPDLIERIVVPTLILAWIDDPAHPLGIAEKLAGLIANVELDVARTPLDVAAWPKRLYDQVRALHPSHREYTGP